jgi:hypothetical protein
VGCLERLNQAYLWQGNLVRSSCGCGDDIDV